MIKIQITEAIDHRPAKIKNDNRVWRDIIVTETHEVALCLLVDRLNADNVDVANNWFRIVTV